MTVSFYKMRWPDQVVPDGEPEWFFYEVDANADTVLRMVELFGDDRAVRNSIERESRLGPPVQSLFEMSFSESIKGHTYELISAENFETLYRQADDPVDH
ncbi:MAG: hypothetical protein VXW22_04385 [Pseudomonadota bacterium]|nr:hypothetical protein [Pseudomonadota bacterium]